MRQEELTPLATIVAFDPPQRRNDMAVDAIGLFHRCQCAGMLLQHRLAGDNALAIDEKRHIVPDRRAIFRLRAREAHRLLIEGDIGERSRCERLVDSGANHLIPDAGDAGGKIGCCAIRHADDHQCHRSRCKTSQHHLLSSTCWKETPSVAGCWAHRE
jgi:hypothetical protein